MSVKYYKGTNTGKGFITHADNASGYVSGYPGEIWVTENTAWAARVNVEEKTKAEAQALVDAAINGETDEDGNQLVIALP